jgi:hypothetical protein
VGLVRFFVVFLLGIGAAFGAYGAGVIDYFTHSSMHGWFFHQKPVVLRVSDDTMASDPACRARYAVDNHSSQRVLVLFASANDGFAARTASGYGRGEYGSPGYYGSSNDAPASYGSGNYGSGYYGSGYYGSGYYGSSEPDTSLNGASSASDAAFPHIRTQAAIPVEVAPGEEKYIRPLDGSPNINSASGRYGAGVNAALAALRCGSGRLVTLRLDDCTTNESGVCSTAGTFSPGEDFNSY